MWNQQIKVAQDFANATIEALNTEQGIHAETAVAGAARMAGTFLFRSFGFPLQDIQPGQVVLSDQANAQGPVLLEILGSVLSQIGIVLDEEELSDDTGSETKSIESSTFVHLCESTNGLDWVSSGEECTVCEQGSEPIAYPLRSADTGDQSALARSLDVAIVPVAYRGRTLLLKARHNGTKRGSRLTWHTSAGHVAVGENGIAEWHLPSDPGPHLVQLALVDGESAAVASFRFRHRA